MTTHRRNADGEPADSAARIWQVYADHIGIPDARALAGEEPPASDSDLLLPLQPRSRRRSSFLGRPIAVMVIAAVAAMAGTAFWRTLSLAPATLESRAVPVSAGEARRSADHPTPATTREDRPRPSPVIAARDERVPAPRDDRAAADVVPAATTAVAGPTAVSISDPAPPAVGEMLPYRITFDLGSDRVNDGLKPILSKVVAVMKANPGWRLAIEGHADALGAADFNQALSERRAQAIKAHLESAGIASSRLSAHGFGASRPVAPHIPHGSVNRRVELHRR
jgi:outer membrane protein OmpA-like peptidoglycan-associated protein